MTRLPRCAALLLVMAAGGCGPPALTDVQVAAADLTGATTVDLALLGGGGYGRADLSILAVDGARFRLPVHLDVGLAGAMIEFGLAANDGMTVDLSRHDDEGPVTAADLLTTYEGFRGALLVGVGIHGWELESESHLGLTGGGGGLGLSLFAGHAWVGVGAEGDLEPLSTSNPPPADAGSE